jgi:hypothetical protein
MATPNKRLAQSRPEGGFALRVFHREQAARKVPRYLIKCGCCDERVEIYYDANTLEINGVIGTLANWREILLPLLYPSPSPDGTAALPNE